ncbi:NAD(P)-binding protein [Plenodomus tracheiphilus IPT5]|uniref:NAD(P)-binding protein n=1 Tax=Plenodomus tracheiphilus IPT5 TaxID=1408161 RepID=A0A6A7AZV3_9PLEO|nr:NAD(P)-binding protein [Plenodomus tracheiphilus IPT5]
MIALTSATGKLGSAVLAAILENKLIDPKELVVCTSSSPSSSRFQSLRDQNITIRYANFDEPSSLTAAYNGCTSLFLVSTPRIEMDYNDAPLWKGREAHHRAAIDAAISVGIKHIYYTSLSFANPSKAGVMRAHIRTEAYLHELESASKVNVTVVREGLYNESWPLYFGYYFGLKGETRKEVVVAGDGRISWTSIADMAFGTARVLAAPGEEWAGKTFYLSQKKTWSLCDIAGIVGKIKGEEVRLKIVSRKEYEDYYVGEMGMERPSVEWWSSSYDALKDGECAIDDPTLEMMLKEAGRTPKALEETIEEMMR